VANQKFTYAKPFNQMLRGHYAYYGIAGNNRALKSIVLWSVIGAKC